MKITALMKMALYLTSLRVVLKSQPDIVFALTVEHMAILMDRVDPLADSDSFGMDLYHQSLEFVLDIMSSHPDVYGT